MATVVNTNHQEPSEIQEGVWPISDDFEVHATMRQSRLSKPLGMVSPANVNWTQL